MYGYWVGYRQIWAAMLLSTWNLFPSYLYHLLPTATQQLNKLNKWILVFTITFLTQDLLFEFRQNQSRVKPSFSNFFIRKGTNIKIGNIERKILLLKHSPSCNFKLSWLQYVRRNLLNCLPGSMNCSSRVLEFIPGF